MTFPSGVPHGGDVGYFLNTVDTAGATNDIMTDEDGAFARRASDYWFEFARSGAPTSIGMIEWPSHAVGRDRTMVFGTTTAVQTNFMRPRLNVFIGVLKTLGYVLNRG